MKLQGGEAMRHKQIWICFLCIEAIVYLSFLTLDLTGKSGPDTALKYAGVLLCLAFSVWQAARGGDRLVPPALALTALADSLLLVADSHYALGVVIFLGAQSVYLVRLRLATGQSWLPLRAGLPLVMALALYGLNMATALNLLAGLYFSQLLINTVLAWTLSGRRGRLFAFGLTLFVCCDLCVGAFNSPGLVPDQFYAFAAVGMWLFYLPSQVLIALSAAPEKGNQHEEL
jgi:hypothetical protein